METTDHVLIVDDDRGIRELLATYLEKNGMRVSLAANGRQMRAVLEQGAPDLIVLDLMLPGEDGLVLCRELRAGKFRAVPVLMLTARNEEADRIVGLEMGADDYLPKPFAVRELLARIRSVLRRARMLPPGMEVTRIGARCWASATGGSTPPRAICSTPKARWSRSRGAEYRLLRVFLDHPQRVLTRDQLLNLTQGRQADPFDRSIDLLVSRLRQRLRDVAREPRYIKTLRSEGYVFSAAVTRRSRVRNERCMRPAALAAHAVRAARADSLRRARARADDVVLAHDDRARPVDDQRDDGLHRTRGREFGRAARSSAAGRARRSGCRVSRGAATSSSSGRA